MDGPKFPFDNRVAKKKNNVMEEQIVNKNIKRPASWRHFEEPIESKIIRIGIAVLSKKIKTHQLSSTQKRILIKTNKIKKRPLLFIVVFLNIF